MRTPEALPDLGAYTEDQWRAAKTLHAWRTMCGDLRARYASERERRLVAQADPKERQAIERLYCRLEEPLLATEPPDRWAEDNPEATRVSVVERPLGLRMVTWAGLNQRELDEHARKTGQRYRYLAPGDGQERPAGFGSDEGVYVRGDGDE